MEWDAVSLLRIGEEIECAVQAMYAEDSEERRGGSGDESDGADGSMEAVEREKYGGVELTVLREGE